MVDVVDKATRSRMMSGIRAKNTNPERLVRSLLHRSGFRFRLHCDHLPGKPDMVFPKYGAVIFVHGCFWHCHRCHMFKWPRSNRLFWRKKISANYKRDKRHVRELLAMRWRVAIVWECALRGPHVHDVGRIVNRASAWLHSNRRRLEISGKMAE
jgi:DNA mismatch endonuclease (patch repair protein)